MATVWPHLATMALLATLAWLAWPGRSVPGARPFAVACFSSLWARGSAAALGTTDPSAKLAWLKFQSVWQIPALTAAVCFAGVRPTGRWLTRCNLILLAIPSVEALAPILTGDLHPWLARLRGRRVGRGAENGLRRRLICWR